VDQRTDSGQSAGAGERVGALAGDSLGAATSERPYRSSGGRRIPGLAGIRESTARRTATTSSRNPPVNVQQESPWQWLQEAVGELVVCDWVQAHL
jgi:hypothetical protein